MTERDREYDRVSKMYRDLNTLCRELGIECIIAVESKDKSGRITKIDNIHAVLYADIAYIDGVCVKHRHRVPEEVPNL